jgi:hypothetical protein
MVADPPSDLGERTLKQFTALLFNLASGRLQNSWKVDVSPEGCSSTHIGSLVAELSALIASGEAGNYSLAAECAGAVNDGAALGLEASSGEISQPHDATLSQQPDSSTATVETARSSGGRRSGTPQDDSARAHSVAEHSEAPRTSIWLMGAPSEVKEREASVSGIPPDARGVGPDPMEDELGTIRRHLAVLGDASALESARDASTDALLTALSGGYEPGVRIRIVKGLLVNVDDSLTSLLVEHLKDIRDEARDFGVETLARAAEELLQRLEPSAE